jgi:hypothetical protein
MSHAVRYLRYAIDTGFTGPLFPVTQAKFLSFARQMISRFAKSEIVLKTAVNVLQCIRMIHKDNGFATISIPKSLVPNLQLLNSNDRRFLTIGEFRLMYLYKFILIISEVEQVGNLDTYSIEAILLPDTEYGLIVRKTRDHRALLMNENEVLIIGLNDRIM